MIKGHDFSVYILREGGERLGFLFFCFRYKKSLIKNGVVIDIIPDPTELSFPAIFMIYTVWYFAKPRPPSTALLCYF